MWSEVAGPVSTYATSGYRLREAVQIIHELWDGGYVTYRGEHFDVESAKVWDLPEQAPDIGIAVSGPQSCRLAGELGDIMIAVEPKPELGEFFDAAGGAGKPRIGQQPLSFGTDATAAVRRAHEQFRWFGGGWKVNADLPGPTALDAASSYVRPDDVAESIPCGDAVEDFVEACTPFVDAGFTHLALVQIGGDQQQPFFDWAQASLLPALREAFG